MQLCSMTAPPVHVNGTAIHQRAAWALWGASILVFLLYAFYTIYDGHNKRADPPSSVAMIACNGADCSGSDYNAPQVLLCPSSATGGPFYPKFHEFTMPPPPSNLSKGGGGAPSPPTKGGGGAKGRRLQRGGPPGAEKVKGANDLLGSDGALTEAGLSLLKLPYCVITLRDDTEFPCELKEVTAGKGIKRKCLVVQSDYIGICEQPEREPGQKPGDVEEKSCDSDASREWVSISVRFMFEILRAPPIFAKEFKAFMFEHPHQIKLMDQGLANTFGVPFDSYTTLTLQRLVHYVLRVGPRAEDPGEQISYSAMGASSAIGYFPEFTGNRGKNYTIALELVKNPAVTQQVRRANRPACMLVRSTSSVCSPSVQICAKYVAPVH